MPLTNKQIIDQVQYVVDKLGWLPPTIADSVWHDIKNSDCLDQSTYEEYSNKFGENSMDWNGYYLLVSAISSCISESISKLSPLELINEKQVITTLETEKDRWK